MKSRLYAARFLGRYQGRNVYRVPVRVLHNSSALCATVREDLVYVDAYTAADAANLVRDEHQTMPETEIYAYGPKGGRTGRYVGWYTAIGASLRLERGPRQLGLADAW